MEAQKNSERLFKFILKCNRNRNKPDLHSFMIDIDGGRAFVECRGFEVFIETYEKEKKSLFAGNEIAATNFLLARGADCSSIEM